MIFFDDVVSKIDRCPVCGFGVSVSDEWVKCGNIGRWHLIVYHFPLTEQVVKEIRIWLPRIEWQTFIYHPMTGVWNSSFGRHHSSDIWELLRMKR